MNATRVTIEDVAREAGVSVATVSRALRGLPNVSPRTRDRVETVAFRLRYRPDPAAARLATGRSRTIGLGVPIPGSWYFAQVMAGAEAVLAEHGYDLLLYAVDDVAARGRFLAEAGIPRSRMDGVILVELPLDDDELARLAATTPNVVIVGGRSGSFDSVAIDNCDAARVATRHLVGLGHVRIGLIGCSPEGATCFTVPQHRREGWLAALAEADISALPEWEQAGDFSVVGGTEAMARLLTLAEAPTAVLAMSDEMAMGALRAVRDAGMRCPDDVSVMGIDDHELSEVIGLTTIRQPVVDHGAIAARMLVERLDDPGRPRQQHLAPTELVVRATTGPP